MSAADRKAIHPRIPTALKERLDRVADERMIGTSLIVERGIERELDRLEAEASTNGAQR